VEGHVAGSAIVRGDEHVNLAQVLRAVDAADLRRVTHFVAVAEELHFGRAADRLFMSQPALSQSVRKLEQSLGILLFERTSRRVSLTPAGHVLLQEATEALGSLLRMVERTVATAERSIATLAVGYAPACSRTATRVISALAESAPAVTQAVLAGTLDVGMTLSGWHPPGLASRPLRRFPLMCAMDESHPLAGRGCVTPRDLSDYPLIVVKSSIPSAWMTALRTLLEGAGAVPQFRLVPDPFQELPKLMREAAGLWPMTGETPLHGGVLRPVHPTVEIGYDVIWREHGTLLGLDALLAVVAELSDA
jgi:DNA-binding transcriptional LysR family regulator